MNIQKEERNFPTLEEVDKTAENRMEALKRLGRRRDSKLIDLLLGTLFVSLMSVVLRWTKKGEKFVELADKENLRLLEAEWHEWNRTKKEAQKFKERSILDLVKLISDGSYKEIAQEEKVEPAILKVYEPFGSLLPELVLEGLDETVAFRAHMCGAGKKVFVLLKNMELDKPTRVYLVGCNLAISKVIQASEQFAQEAFGYEEGHKAPSHVFDKVRRGILNSPEFRELFSYKEGKKFTARQAKELAEDWGLLEEEKKAVSKSSKKETCKKQDHPEKEDLVERFIAIGVDELSAESLVKKVLKTARRKDCSVAEALSVCAVNKQLQTDSECNTLDATALLYGQVAGFDGKSLKKRVAKKIQAQKKQAETQSAEDLRKKKGYKPSTSSSKHKNKKRGVELKNSSNNRRK